MNIERQLDIRLRDCRRSEQAMLLVAKLVAITNEESVEVIVLLRLTDWFAMIPDALSAMLNLHA